MIFFCSPNEPGSWFYIYLSFISYSVNKYSLKMHFIPVLILETESRKINFNPVFAYKGGVSIHWKLIVITSENVLLIVNYSK